ncbi:hypothetical protein IIA95_01640 [Patescibacteria group bacterium]|nr:hypothetical protein [Patescibacteria group bacterium]
MTPHALLFTLAAIGISETAYLIRERIAHKDPVCPIGTGCNVVLGSKYNKIFGIIHNDILGLASYIALAFLSAFLVIGIGPLTLWVILVKTLIFIGIAMSFFLIYIQWRIIKAWCFWCLMAVFIVFSMEIIVLTSNLILV